MLAVIPPGIFAGVPFAGILPGISIKIPSDISFRFFPDIPPVIPSEVLLGFPSGTPVWNYTTNVAGRY